MACVKHTPCQHDSHDHNAMICVEVSPLSANLRAIRSRGCPLDSGKGRVWFVPLSGPKLASKIHGGHADAAVYHADFITNAAAILATLLAAILSPSRSDIRAARFRVHSSRMRADHLGLKNSWAASVNRTSRTSIGNIVHASRTTAKRSKGTIPRDRIRPRLRWPSRARPAPLDG